MRDSADYERIGSTMQTLGMAVSPDECSLALRGMQTLGVRLDALERSTLDVARWLAGREEIASGELSMTRPLNSIRLSLDFEHSGSLLPELG